MRLWLEAGGKAEEFTVLNLDSEQSQGKKHRAEERVTSSSSTWELALPAPQTQRRNEEGQSVGKIEGNGEEE